MAIKGRGYVVAVDFIDRWPGGLNVRIGDQIETPEQRCRAEDSDQGPWPRSTVAWSVDRPIGWCSERERHSSRVGSVVCRV